MDLLQTTLTIDGTDYDADGRAAVGLVVDQWAWSYDGDLDAAFHEEGPNMQSPTEPSFLANRPVSIAVDGSRVFFGVISSASPAFTGGGWEFNYRCRGPKYMANQFYITAGDGTGTMRYNLSPRDDYYIPANAGRSVGQILAAVLSQHAATLTALGITTDATTTAQLAALTLVPPEPVYVTGRLWQGIDGVLRQWARNVTGFINAAGKVRFIDTTAAGTTVTFTEGVDPFGPFRFGYGLDDSASRVQVRGSADVAPVYLRLSKNELAAAWTGTQQSAWSYADFATPADAYDTGTVNTVLSGTSVRVHSTDAAKAWAANFWSGRQAWIHLYKNAGTGLTFTEARPVTANTALTAGGTSDVTLGYPLDNAGSTAYDSYALVGTVGALSTSRNDVWRLFSVADPYIAAHLVKLFPTDVPFFAYHGDGASLTRYPSALIVDSNGVTVPATFKIVPDTGQIRFDEPVVKAFNSMTDLNTGGAAVTAPADIYVLLAYSRGALTATYPPDVAGVPQYAGTSYGVFGLQRTKTIDVDSWIYAGDRTQFQDLAEMHHKAVKDAVYQGSIPVLGAVADAFDPGAGGLTVDLAADGYTTGQESLAIPVRGYTLRYVTDGGGGVLYRSELACSSRRDPATGDRYYVHPRTLEQLTFKLPDASLNLASFGGLVPNAGAGLPAAAGPNPADAVPNPIGLVPTPAAPDPQALMPNPVRVDNAAFDLARSSTVAQLFQRFIQQLWGGGNG